MANGFIVIDDDDWEHADPEQRAWMTFKTLKSMDERLKKIESRTWLDKGCAFLGGIIGGAAAFIGIKIGG